MATVRKKKPIKATARKTPARPKSTTGKRTAAKRPAAPGTKTAARHNGKTAPTKPELSQADQLQQELAHVESELSSLRSELQEAPELTGDEVDLNIYERERTLGLVATYERRLAEINATLAVAAKGQYGICERCGKPIDPERLKIFPETRLCITCRTEVEREQRRLRV